MKYQTLIIALMLLLGLPRTAPAGGVSAAGTGSQYEHPSLSDLVL